MEDVLDVYTRHYDPKRPQVCLDETSRQVLAEIRPPLLAVPRRPVSHDPESVRGGGGQPVRGLRAAAGMAAAAAQRPADADRLGALRPGRRRHPLSEAEQVVLVLDHLNTHSPASLYEAFAPAEAKRIADRLEIHDTPKHGSWLNMADIELSALQRQCLDRRLADRPTGEREVAVWVATRNAAETTIDWRFTTEDARINLTRLYPAVHA